MMVAELVIQCFADDEWRSSMVVCDDGVNGFLNDNLMVIQWSTAGIQGLSNCCCFMF